MRTHGVDLSPNLAPEEPGIRQHQISDVGFVTSGLLGTPKWRSELTGLAGDLKNQEWLVRWTEANAIPYWVQSSKNPFASILLPVFRWSAWCSQVGRFGQTIKLAEEGFCKI